LEIPVENPEEGCDDKDDVLAPRNLTFKLISLSFSRREEGLDIIVVYNCVIYSQEYASVYNRVYIVYIIMRIMEGEGRRRNVTYLLLKFLMVKMDPLNVVSHNVQFTRT
jgi:hypothetical protein